MALRTVIEIDVKDDKWKAFEKSFADFQKAAAGVPDIMDRISNAGDIISLQAQAATVADLGAQWAMVSHQAREYLDVLRQIKNAGASIPMPKGGKGATKEPTGPKTVNTTNIKTNKTVINNKSATVTSNQTTVNAKTATVKSQNTNVNAKNVYGGGGGVGGGGGDATQRAQTAYAVRSQSQALQRLVALTGTRGIPGFGGLNTLAPLGLLAAGVGYAINRAPVLGEARMTEQGTGMSFGMQNSMQYGETRFKGLQGVYQGLTGANLNRAGMGNVALSGLGLAPVGEEGRVQQSEDVLRRLRALAQETPEDLLGTTVESRQLGAIGVTPEFMRQLRVLGNEEFEKNIKEIRDIAEKDNLTDEQLKAWQDLNSEMTKFKIELMNVVDKALVPLLHWANKMFGVAEGEETAPSKTVTEWKMRGYDATLDRNRVAALEQDSTGNALTHRLAHLIVTGEMDPEQAENLRQADAERRARGESIAHFLNDPLNLKKPGASGNTVLDYRSFDSPEAGLIAAAKQLARNNPHTMGEAVRGWATDAPPQRVEQYLKTMGVSASQPVNVQDTNQLANLLSRMIPAEAPDTPRFTPSQVVTILRMPGSDVYAQVNQGSY